MKSSPNVWFEYRIRAKVLARIRILDPIDALRISWNRICPLEEDFFRRIMTYRRNIRRDMAIS